MNWSMRIRQFHRWMAVAFTVGFIVNLAIIFGLGQSEPAVWVYLLVLIPLFLLFPTGLYMLALSYVPRWRGARRPVGQE